MARYPQLDLLPYQSRHVSTDLADLVSGYYHLSSFDHMDKIHRIEAIRLVYQAVLDLGMLEHTGDWDWRITVTYKLPDAEGESEAGTPSVWVEGDDTWSDTFYFPYEVEPSDYLDGFARWENLAVEEFDDRPDPTTRLVPVDCITKITIGEA